MENLQKMNALSLLEIDLFLCIISYFSFKTFLKTQ